VYRCELCSSVVPASTPEIRVVVERREREYPARHRANRLIERLKGERDQRHRDDPGGHGSEIVHEARVCAACAERHA
jgi:hypothetical protein